MLTCPSKLYTGWRACLWSSAAYKEEWRHVRPRCLRLLTPYAKSCPEACPTLRRSRTPVLHSNLPSQPELAQKPSPSPITNCIALSAVVFIRLDRRHVEGFENVGECTRTLVRVSKYSVASDTSGRDGTTPHVEAEMFPFYNEFAWQGHCLDKVGEVYLIFFLGGAVAGAKVGDVRL